MDLAGNLALLAATVAAVFGVALLVDGSDVPLLAGSAAREQETPQAKLDPGELLALSEERAPLVARRVAKLRGIDFEQVPKPQLTHSSELRELAQRELAKPKLAEAVATSDIELRLLGLLDGGESLADATTEVTAGAAAYYDPKEKELFILGDAVPAGPALTEFVLSHELDHALEDQVFGLPPSVRRNDDRALAETALVEGSATALMTDYAAKFLSVSDLLSDTAALPAETEGLPPIILAQVQFAYFGGQRFVDELRRTVEGGWDLVDFAYEGRAPASTEQILHPEKYLADEAPLPVGRVPGAGSGWKEIDSGVVGEFVTREILRHEAEELGADAAAEGWGGDRYRLFRRDGADEACGIHCGADHAMVIVWRADSASDADELRRALEGFVERSLDPAPIEGGIWPLESGFAAVEGEGDVVTFARAPSAAMARRLSRPIAPVE
jgi:hypothetical protein